MGVFLFPGSLSLTVFFTWYSLAIISNSVVYGSTFTLQSILNVILLRRTLNCDSDLLDGSFDWEQSMAVLLIDAFSIIILNLAFPGSSFYYYPSWNSFDCGVHWKYFCLFLAVLWIVILPCDTFIVVLSDSTLDMSVIFSGSPFVFDTPCKYFCLQHSNAILLIVVLPGSIRLDSYYNFCSFECSIAVVFIIIIPDNTILLYSLAVILIVILRGILFNFGTLSYFF